MCKKYRHFTEPCLRKNRHFRKPRLYENTDLYRALIPLNTELLQSPTCAKIQTFYRAPTSAKIDFLQSPLTQNDKQFTEPRLPSIQSSEYLVYRAFVEPCLYNLEIVFTRAAPDFEPFFMVICIVYCSQDC